MFVYDLLSLAEFSLISAIVTYIVHDWRTRKCLLVPGLATLWRKL